MKILVCGGRTYGDQAKVFDVLDAVDRRRPIKAIIQAGENGAEAIAREWAESRHVKLRTYTVRDKIVCGEACWASKNQRMLDATRPTLVVAFPGARRTADLVSRARAAGLTILEVD